LASEWTPELERWIREQALEVGFDAAGVADVSAPTSDEQKADAERFADWVDAGRAGEMEYLKRRDETGTLVRSNLRVAMPWARSIIMQPPSAQASNGWRT